MALGRNLPKVVNHDIPGMFTGSLRVMAAVLLKTLQQDGHKPFFYYPGSRQQGLYIGLAKESTLLVKSNPDFSWSEAQAHAKRINDTFRKALPKAAGLVKPVRGQLGPNATYVEVHVSCPKDRVLRALYLNLMDE